MREVIVRSVIHLQPRPCAQPEDQYRYQEMWDLNEDEWYGLALLD
ncbi:MAG: hypothetical protein NT074_01895 [Methanomicrobiales archaeon]|jgi:hypothetical protein|nr:hypothetical protein [Methanomicrobiales archaeon]